MTELPRVEVWVDGACRHNPGPGGWAATLRYHKRSGEIVAKDVSGGASDTTNNAMELTAVLEALKALKTACQVTVYTDSQNAIGWLCYGWRCRHAHLVTLRDAILSLVEEKGHQVAFKKVKAHSGNSLNEHVDSLAVAAIPSATVADIRKSVLYGAGHQGQPTPRRWRSLRGNSQGY